MLKEYIFNYNQLKLVKIELQKAYFTIVKYKNKDDLQKKIAPLTFRALKKDCLDLPTKIYKKEFVSLSQQQKQMYNKFKKDHFYMIDNAEISTTFAMTVMLRLQQMTGGHYKLDDSEKPTPFTKNPKLEKLMEVLEYIATDAQIIIWARFTPEIKAIYKEISEKYGEESCCMYYGETAAQERLENKLAFQEGKFRFFIANPTVAGMGLDLYCASYCIYFSNSFDSLHRTQSQDRAHRIGQIKNVTIIDLIVDKTIDTYILKKLENKENLSNNMINHLKEVLS